MASGIRTEVKVGMPGGCPVAEASREANTTARSVARSMVPTPDGGLVGEFTAEAGSIDAESDISESFTIGSESRYRFRRGCASDCVCSVIEGFDCPISEIYADGGALFITFYSPEMETIKRIVAELREHFSGVDVRHLSRSGDLSNQELVVLDRSKLTKRQLEVLQTAQDMGYFAHPKGANATDVAAELDISPSTLSEHLAAAQSKIMDGLLNA